MQPAATSPLSVPTVVADRLTLSRRVVSLTSVG